MEPVHPAEVVVHVLGDGGKGLVFQVAPGEDFLETRVIRKIESPIFAISQKKVSILSNGLRQAFDPFADGFCFNVTVFPSLIATIIR